MGTAAIALITFFIALFGLAIGAAIYAMNYAMKSGATTYMCHYMTPHILHSKQYSPDWRHIDIKNKELLSGARDFIKVYKDDFWLRINDVDISKIYVSGYDTSNFDLTYNALAYVQFMTRLSNLEYHYDIFEEEEVVKLLLENDIRGQQQRGVYSECRDFEQRLSLIKSTFEKCIGEHIEKVEKLDSNLARTLAQAQLSMLDEIHTNIKVDID